MDLKGDIGHNTAIMGNFNTPPTFINGQINHYYPCGVGGGENKETRGLMYTMSQMNLTVIYRLFHPTTTAYTFYSSVHRTFSWRDKARLQIKSQQTKNMH